MSMYLVLDTSSVIDRYQTTTAWFKSRRSGHWSVFMKWNMAKYPLPMIEVYHKAVRGDAKREIVYLGELIARYQRAGEPLSLSQAKLLLSEVKLEVTATIGRYNEWLKGREFRVSHRTEGEEVAPKSSQSWKEFNDVGLCNWLREIAKDPVPCYRRNEDGTYKLDDLGKKELLYHARHDTKLPELVKECNGICSDCLECAGCDVPCQAVNLPVIIPLIHERRRLIELEGPINEVEREWYERTRGVRIFKAPSIQTNEESHRAVG